MFSLGHISYYKKKTKQHKDNNNKKQVALLPLCLEISLARSSSSLGTFFTLPITVGNSTAKLSSIS